MFFSKKVSICLRQNLTPKLLLSTSVRRGARKGIKWDVRGGTSAGAMVIFFPRHQLFALVPMDFPPDYLQKHKQHQELPTAPSGALNFPSGIHSPCSC